MLWHAIVWIFLLWFVGTPVVAALRGELPAGLKELVLIGALLFIILAVFGGYGRRPRRGQDEGMRLLEWQNRETLDSHHRDRRDF